MFLSTIVQLVAELMRLYQDTFLATGLAIHRSITICLIVYFGVQVALSGYFDLNKFAHTIFLMALCWWMMYSYPTFWSAITGAGAELARRLAADLEAQLYQPIQEAYRRLTDSPGAFWAMLLSPSALLVVWRNLVVTALVLLTQTVATFVLATGFIIQCVLVILGPLFIPFLIVPKLDFIFWGWFKGLLQYSFYPVVANAIVLVVVKMLTRAGVWEMLSSNPQDLQTYFGAILLFFFLAILMMLKVPSIVNQLFAGQAVQDALGGMLKAGAGFATARLMR